MELDSTSEDEDSDNESVESDTSDPAPPPEPSGGDLAATPSAPPNEKEGVGRPAPAGDHPAGKRKERQLGAPDESMGDADDVLLDLDWDVTMVGCILTSFWCHKLVF